MKTTELKKHYCELMFCSFLSRSVSQKAGLELPSVSSLSMSALSGAPVHLLNLKKNQNVNQQLIYSPVKRDSFTSGVHTLPLKALTIW